MPAAASIEPLERRFLLTANVWKAGVSGSWEDGTKWSLGHAPLATEDVSIVAAGTYSVSVHGSTDVAQSVLLGGGATSHPTLNLTSSNATTYAQLTVGNGFTNHSIISLNNAATVGYFARLTVTAGGLVNAAGASIIAGGLATSTVVDYLNASITNAGTISVTAPNGLTITTNAASSNNGTINVIGGDCTIAQTQPFTNTGTIAVSAGRKLSVQGGTFNLNAPGTVAGAGATVSFAGTTVNLGISYSDASVGTLTVPNTTFNGPGTLTNAAGKSLTLSATTINCALVNQGTLVPQGSANSITGALTTSAGSAINLTSSNAVTYAQLTVASGFTNNGTITLNNTATVGYFARLIVTSGLLVNPAGSKIIADGLSTATVVDYLNAAVTNAGSISVTAPQGFTLTTSAASTNSGSIAVTGGNFNLSQTTSFTNTGTISIGSGHTLAVQGGTFNMNAGSISGAGSTLSFAGVTVNLGISFSNASVGTFTVPNTTFNGPGTLTNAAGKSLTLSATTINCAMNNQGTLVPQGSANSITGALTTFAGSAINLTSSNAVTYAQLTVSSGFTNNGTITLNNTATVGYFARLIVTSGLLVNPAGSKIIAAGLSTATVVDYLNAAVTNAGSISVTAPQGFTLTTSAASTNSGSITATGGNFNLSQTTTFTNTGTISIGSGHTLAVQGGTFNLNAGSISGAGSTLSFSSVTVNLGISYSDASVGKLIVPNTTFNGPGTLTNAGGKSVTLSATTIHCALVNQGTLVPQGSANSITGALTTSAGSVINLTSSNAVTYAQLTVSSGFTNNGTIALNNTATVGYFARLIVTAGTLTNAAGARISAAGASTAIVTDYINAVVSNSGTLAVSAPKGLTITGSYTQTATGTYAITLKSPGTIVTGAAKLAGLLDIYLAGGVHPALGQIFPIMTYASHTGDFTSLDGYSVGGGVALSKAPGATVYNLKGVVAAADSTVPKVSAFSASTPVANATSYTFTITFSDNIAIDVSSLGNVNINVTGPNGFSQLAKLVSVSKSNNGTPRTATYRITPAGGKIVHADNGTYNVNVVAGTVKDTRGNAVAAGLIGTFVFNVL